MTLDPIDWTATRATGRRMVLGLVARRRRFAAALTQSQTFALIGRFPETSRLFRTVE